MTIDSLRKEYPKALIKDKGFFARNQTQKLYFSELRSQSSHLIIKIDDKFYMLNKEMTDELFSTSPKNLSSNFDVSIVEETVKIHLNNFNELQNSLKELNDVPFNIPSTDNLSELFDFLKRTKYKYKIHIELQT